MSIRSLKPIAGHQWSGSNLWSCTLAMVKFTACIIRLNILCVSCKIWSFEFDNRWYKAAGWSFMIFLVLSKIYNSDLRNSWIVSNFRFLCRLWFNVLVKYITDLSFLSIRGLSLDFYSNLLLMDDKGGVSRNFNQSKKVRYC